MNHIPVLEEETINFFNYLTDIPRAVFVDGTLGAAGHSLSIAKKYGIKNSKKIVGIDKDKKALEIARDNIQHAGLIGNFILVHDDFKNINKILAELDIDKFDGALLDLGVSSMQLDQKERGFSFQNESEILDMRMDKSQEKSARTVVNLYPEEKLMKILFDFGEEKYAREIAKNIVIRRRGKPVETVGDLVDIIKFSIPMKIQKTGKIHFATRTFQAIRIEVNDELSGLDNAINQYVEHLSPGGRLAIITFHSLEDRIVKHAFLKLQNPCICPSEMPCMCGRQPIVKILTRKPIEASEDERMGNPRSRSAKLRAVEKL